MLSMVRRLRYAEPEHLEYSRDDLWDVFRADRMLASEGKFDIVVVIRVATISHPGDVCFGGYIPI